MLFEVFNSEAYENIALLKPGYFQWMLAFISCGSKKANIRCMGSPVIISKVESLWAPKGMDLRFRRNNGNANGQGIWRVSINFANYVLMMWLVHWVVALGRLIRGTEMLEHWSLLQFTCQWAIFCLFVSFCSNERGR